MAECEETLKKGEIPRGIKESQDPDVEVERTILPAFIVDSSRRATKIVSSMTSSTATWTPGKEREGGIVPLAAQVMSS